MDDATLPTEGALASDATDGVPTRLGRYEVQRAIGRGGMGAVYDALDPELARHVAIKMLRGDLAAADRDALRREAQALAKLAHPNVVAVYDVGVDDKDRMFLVMQLVDGAPIDRWARVQRASPAAIVAAFRQAGLGLAAAHAAGLVHRDIKPSNILVDTSGATRVGDFGIARAVDDAGSAAATHPRIVGTPAYMAPEQLAGRATAASDQYAFCCALWEVLAGEIPSDVTALRRSAAVPPHVDRVVRRGLATDPAARFPSMAALVDALAPPRTKRHAAIAGAAVVLVAAALAIVVASRGDDTAAPAPPPPPPTPPTTPPTSPSADPAVRLLTHYGSAACAYSPAITDDGQVVFDRTEGDRVDLYTVPLAGGEPRQLTSAPTWEWHATPGRVPGEIVHVIADSKTNATSIAALDLATDRDAVIADATVLDVATAGGVVYYLGPRPELHRLDHGRDESVASLLPDGTPLGLTASRDGARLAALAVGATSTPQLCTYEVSSRQTSCVVVDHAGGGRPAFSSDGHAIFYGGASGLRRLDLATGSDSVVVALGAVQGGAAVAPGGSTIVASLCGNTERLVDESATPPAQIVDDPNAGEPSFARDGTIAFAGHPEGWSVVMVQDPSGHVRQVSDARMRGIRTPAISPDGQHVAFAVGKPTAGIYVAAIGPHGAAPPLTDDATDQDPTWLDDDTLAFDRDDGAGSRDLYVMRLEDVHPRRVARACSPGAVRHGEILVVCARRSSWLDPATGREHAITQQIPEDSRIGTASPSGRWLALSFGQLDQTIAILDLDDPHGAPRTVVSLPSGHTLDGYAVTDDGHVVVAVATWSGNLVAISAAPGTHF